MSIENASYVAGLDITLPTDDNDYVYEGDDHLRLIKSVLINSFPNIDGAVTVTDTEINYLSGLTGNIQTQIDDINTDLDNLIESTTRMLFHQTAAPTGWTKDTTANLNNTALRIVTGTVGSRVDQSSFSTVFGLTATDGHALTIAEMPSHNHPMSGVSTVSGGNYSYGNGGGGSRYMGNDTNSTSNRGGGDPHSHDIDMRVNYHDVIIAVKD